MTKTVIDALRKTAFEDLGFYAFKANLRKAFPDADMIEAAENTVTIVQDGKTTVLWA